MLTNAQWVVVAIGTTFIGLLGVVGGGFVGMIVGLPFAIVVAVLYWWQGRARRP